jgi:hypothetical protein
MCEALFEAALACATDDGRKKKLCEFVLEAAMKVGDMGLVVPKSAYECINACFKYLAFKGHGSDALQTRERLRKVARMSQEQYCYTTDSIVCAALNLAIFLLDHHFINFESCVNFASACSHNPLGTKEKFLREITCTN